ncbi:D-alanyl-D-alanine carboxypeptidase family protein [Brevibacillus humidisoli]|uniref:D-alanyl-D-alanine carboxypeptidase family protein n=1 Tax=Brevibacillus humidisoli TaxID=2895522 RepID=UPI001E3131DE|nr:D-alanyl-D-alanine carboxypeptidase family protein [Brevibacillus humidisoli]UFJ41814.1 D-alanyl-D-alanine carboxypeptidase family protein [Brevibacillus humidisoli]
MRIIGERLIQEEDGYVVILQLDKASTEFAEEGRRQPQKDGVLADQTVEYVRRRFPHLKVKTVKIMVGTVLVATFSLTGAGQQDEVHAVAAVEAATGPQSLVQALPGGILTLGARGDGVKTLQTSLNHLGFSLAQDGIYGPRTRAAVLQFQQGHLSLANDGIYGPHTRYVIETLLMGKRVVVNPDDQLVVVNKQNRLPPGYVPRDLVVADVRFSFAEDSPKKWMRREAAEALAALFTQAEKENIQLYAVSGYRSYERQEAIFAANMQRVGADSANQFSARAGESEHQTGLAMDVTSAAAGYRLTTGFGETKEGKWLQQHAAEFGFIIRYPQGKETITGYQYEPWHLRYVGKEAATTIAARGSTLEEYVGIR